MRKANSTLLMIFRILILVPGSVMTDKFTPSMIFRTLRMTRSAWDPTRAWMRTIKKIRTCPIPKSRSLLTRKIKRPRILTKKMKRSRKPKNLLMKLKNLKK